MRNPLLQCVLALVALLVLVGSPAARAAERPNILLLFADDWGQYAGAYADSDAPSPSDVVDTPNVDRVAENGVLFHNAFISSPSCTPSRAALTTGMHFYRTGKKSSLHSPNWPDEAPDIFADLPGFTGLLKNAGYHVGHVGKTASKIPAKRYEMTDKMHDVSNVQAGAEDPDAAMQEILDKIRKGFRQYLKDREEGEPLFFWFGSNTCHRRWVRGSGKKFWDIDPADLKGKMPKFLPDVPAVREDFADYLGQVEALDKMHGVLIEELKRIGELENTIVALSGDHGMPGMPRGKTNLYDFGAKVPLVISWPKQIKGGREVTDFTTIPDLAPTFLDAAGIELPRHMQARSLMPVLKAEGSGRITENRDFAIIGRERHVRWGRPRNLPYPARAIRTEDYLYIRNFTPDRWPQCSPEGLDDLSASPPPFKKLAGDTSVAYADVDASPTKAWMIHHRSEPEVKPLFKLAFGKRPAAELYDLKKDPDQMNNVADKSQYADVKKRLHAKLMNYLRSTGDPRVTGDGDAMDYPPYSRPGLTEAAP